MFRHKEDNKIKIPGFIGYMDMNVYNYNRKWLAKAEENFIKGARKIFLT